MNIEEFLEENVYNLTPEEYNQALADLDSLDAKSWIDKHAALMQEKTTGWNKVDEVKRSKPLSQRIADAFADSKFNPGRNFKEDVYDEDFSDVPKKDFDAALAKMKQYYDSEVEAREKEYLKEKRKKEVADWNLVKSALTSDYEKQRYIEDPESALFGEQAPTWGDAKNTRWGSMADLGLGVAGAAADALPGWGSMAGPAVRTFRDIGHKVTDSPYQKSWEDIGKNAMVDVGLSASTAWLPNFRQQQRMLGKGGLVPKDIQNIVDIENAANLNASALKAYHDVISTIPKNASKEEMAAATRYAVGQMPESPLKQQLTPLVSDVNLDMAEINSIILNAGNDFSNAINREGRERLRKAVADDNVVTWSASENKSRLVPSNKKTLSPLELKIVQTPELTPFREKVLKPLSVQADKFLTGDVGGAFLQETKTATGARSPLKPEVVITPEMRDELERIKQSEARFWEAGFAPKKIDGDPMWEAYNEWKEENKLKNIVKKNILGGR